MSPGEITELFETMATTIRTVSHNPAPASQAPAPPAPPAKKSRTKEEWKVLLDPNSEQFDPESVVTEIAERNYGKVMGEINGRAIRGLFGNFRNEFPDFQDYEQDIAKAFAASDPASISEAQVLQAYFTAKGMKTTLKEKQAARQKTTTTHAPTPGAGEAPKEAELTDVEKTVAKRMFRRSDNPEKDYRKFLKLDEEGFTMKVPVGGGKFE